MNKSDILLSCTKPILAALRDDLGMTVAMAGLTPDKTEGEILLTLPGKKVVSFVPKPGFRFPIHVSAPTKAMLALMPGHEQNEIADRLEFPQLTPKTITCKAAFLKELQRDARRKYSVDNGEHAEGINCVGAAVLDGHARPVAGIWVTSLSFNLPASDFKKIAPKIIAAAVKISRELNEGTVSRSFYTNEIIEQAEQHLSHHFAEAINMEQLAGELHIGYSLFRRRFKEKTGKTPNRCLIDLRIQEARKLLSHTHFSIAHIAEKTGYKNQHYFALQFKKETGQTPSEFRNTK